jgi:hypothetical protein
MQFELTHEDIKAAFRNYVSERGVNPEQEIDFVVKTSKRNGRRSRAIITILDGVEVSPQGELPLEALVEAPEVLVEATEEVVSSINEEVATTPVFKKLFV